MNEIREILMRRDGISKEEADSRINEAKKDLDYFLACGDIDRAEMICEDHFGLEPDYLMELL